MTYKKGDKVRVKDKFWELPNHTEIPTEIPQKKALAGKILEVFKITSGGDVITKIGTLGEDIDTSWCWHPSWLEPVHREIEDVQEDDLITDGEWFSRVLGRCGKVVHVTDEWKKEEQEERGYSYTCSIDHLRTNSWSIVQDTPTEDIIELTLEDVAKLKGIDVKKLRIKD